MNIMQIVKWWIIDWIATFKAMQDKELMSAFRDKTSKDKYILLLDKYIPLQDKHEDS